MTTLSGHLTQTDKRNINLLLDAGYIQGKVGKANYFLSLADGIYTVTKAVKDRGLIPIPGSALRISRYTSTFKI